MSIESGTRIGPYEVTSPLGEGGMGVVFRARDTKLQRDVALKLLPDHFATDPDRLSRFQREAQLLASLNHPNIAQIYGLEESSGAGCIVMELVEGETIGQLLKRGPIPVDEALRIIRQVADALEAAHDRGIIHRDLKPANIKLAPDGKVKVLDFGLAKALASRETEINLTNSPTKVSGSMAGVVFGTAAYMSPEQAKAKDVDARTDIWAFGCVLYEMLTGRQAFEGETSTDIIARIVAGQPNWDLLPRETPSSIRVLLKTVLNKEPRDRVQHIGDVRPLLDLAAVPGLSEPQPALGRDGKWRFRLITVSVVVVLLAVIISAALYLRQPAVNAAEIRFEMPAPGMVGNNLSISPDGQRIAYVADAEGKRMIWIRPIGAVAAQPLSGTENATAPFWSPDSRFLAFIADGKLKKIDVAGGPAQILCDAGPVTVAGTWSNDGAILFTAAPNRIVRVSAMGGNITPITAMDTSRSEIVHVAPQYLPDGRHFLYHAINTSNEASVLLGSLDSKPAPAVLLNLGAATSSAPATYAAGYLLFVRGRTLMAQPFDQKRLALAGEAIPLAEQIGGYAFSQNVLVYRKTAGGADQGNLQLAWFARSGKPLGPTGTTAQYRGDIKLSPDKRRVAVDLVQGGNPDIWVIDIARSVASRLTFEGNNWSPIWAPDGSRLVFTRAPNLAGLPIKLYQKASSGVGAEELLFEGDPASETIFTEAWSPDGKSLVFARVKVPSITNADLWILPLSGDRKPVPYVRTGFFNAHSQISPDGRWMAYTTNESGTFQIVVQPFPDPGGGKWQITAKGGTEPKWRNDGRELYYLALDGKMMSVSIKADKTVEAGEPVPLFQTNLPVPAAPIGLKRFDVTADGQRFLIVSPAISSASEGNSNPIAAVVNWTAALRKK